MYFNGVYGANNLNVFGQQNFFSNYSSGGINSTSIFGTQNNSTLLMILMLGILGSFLGNKPQENPDSASSLIDEEVVIEDEIVCPSSSSCEPVHGFKLDFNKHNATGYGRTDTYNDKLFKLFDVNKDNVLDLEENAAVYQMAGGHRAWGNIAGNFVNTTHETPEEFLKALDEIKTSSDKKSNPYYVQSEAAWANSQGYAGVI